MLRRLRSELATGLSVTALGSACVFTTAAGTLRHESRVRKVFARVVKAAGLPAHFSPHSLRHSFALILVQRGISPAYVQRQLGYASIKRTVDTYESACR